MLTYGPCYSVPSATTAVDAVKSSGCTRASRHQLCFTAERNTESGSKKQGQKTPRGQSTWGLSISSHQQEWQRCEVFAKTIPITKDGKPDSTPFPPRQIQARAHCEGICLPVVGRPHTINCCSQGRCGAGARAVPFAVAGCHIPRRLRKCRATVRAGLVSSQSARHSF
jgi:hypothetical protein